MYILKIKDWLKNKGVQFELVTTKTAIRLNDGLFFSIGEVYKTKIGNKFAVSNFGEDLIHVGIISHNQKYSVPINDLDIETDSKIYKLKQQRAQIAKAWKDSGLLEGLNPGWVDDNLLW